SHKGQDHPDEKIDERDNSQCFWSAVLHDEKRVSPAKLRLSSEHLQKCEHTFSSKSNSAQRSTKSGDGGQADPLEKCRLGNPARGALLLRHRLRQLEQCRHSGRKRMAPEFHVLLFAEFEAFQNKSHEPAVPTAEVGSLKCHRSDFAGSARC